MAGTCTKAVIGLVVALVFAGGASAASPDVAAMNLQASDVPGAKVVKQQAVNEQGYLAANFRSFAFSAPSGSSRLVAIRSETALAANSSTAVADVAATEKPFRSTAGRKELVAALLPTRIGAIPSKTPPGLSSMHAASKKIPKSFHDCFRFQFWRNSKA